MKKIILSDLDGTLANIHHRRHLVEPRMIPTLGGIAVRDPAWRPDWDKFHELCVNDQPKREVIDTVKALQEAIGGQLWIVSGRSDAVRDQTKMWLDAYVGRVDRLIMRPAHLFTPDDKLKEEWLLGTEKTSAKIPIHMVHSVFEDRDRVVSMWRRHGLTCFQVAPGAF